MPAVTVAHFVISMQVRNRTQANKKVHSPYHAVLKTELQKHHQETDTESEDMAVLIRPTPECQQLHTQVHNACGADIKCVGVNLHPRWLHVLMLKLLLAACCVQVATNWLNSACCMHTGVYSTHSCMTDTLQGPCVCILSACKHMHRCSSCNHGHIHYQPSPEASGPMLACRCWTPMSRL